MLPTSAPHGLNRWFHRFVFFAASLSLAISSFCFLGVLAAQEAPRKVIARTAPTYPELAKKMHLTGKVKLEVVIAANGTVNSARMVGGNPVFETNAIETVKQWRFESAQTETKTVIVLEFAAQ